jgi:hypothetical protein
MPVDHLLVDGAQMSKSLGNLSTCGDLLKKDTGVHEIAILDEIAAAPKISDTGKTSILLEISSTKRNMLNCDSIWMPMPISKNINYRKIFVRSGKILTFPISRSVAYSHFQLTK